MNGPFQAQEHLPASRTDLAQSAAYVCLEGFEDRALNRPPFA